MQNIALVAFCLCVTACLDQTSIQRDYISERSGCQAQAESRIGDYADELAGDDVRARNAKLVTLFSDCMSERGWSVATPSRETPAAENPLEAARKKQAQNEQPVTMPAPAPQAAPQPMQQPVQQAPVGYYYQPAPASAPIYPQQKVAPNMAPNPSMPAPVYYQPPPQVIYAPPPAPVYYQQVPQPIYATQPAPIYVQPAPAQPVTVQPAAPLYGVNTDNAPDDDANAPQQAPAPVR